MYTSTRERKILFSQSGIFIFGLPFYLSPFEIGTRMLFLFQLHHTEYIKMAEHILAPDQWCSTDTYQTSVCPDNTFTCDVCTCMHFHLGLSPCSCVAN